MRLSISHSSWDVKAPVRNDFLGQTADSGWDSPILTPVQAGPSSSGFRAQAGGTQEHVF
jgi:hypothetical protein